MQYLIDTHVFLWFVSNAKELRQTARTIIEDGHNEIFISIVSLWEIAIKTTIGKLALQMPFSELEQKLLADGFQMLPISFNQMVAYTQLPLHHRDPHLTGC